MKCTKLETSEICKVEKVRGLKIRNFTRGRKIGNVEALDVSKLELEIRNLPRRFADLLIVGDSKESVKL